MDVNMNVPYPDAETLCLHLNVYMYVCAQLTEYVSVLVMMSAPRGKVLERLLNAHKMRSLNMIQTFMAKTSTLRSLTHAYMHTYIHT